MKEIPQRQNIDVLRKRLDWDNERLYNLSQERDFLLQRIRAIDRQVLGIKADKVEIFTQIGETLHERAS